MSRCRHQALALASLALAAISLPLSSPGAADRVLGQPRLLDNGDIQLGDGLKIGRRGGDGKYVSQPDSIQLQGAGSTGPIDGMSVTTGAATKSISGWVGDLAALQRLGGVLRSQISQVQIPVTVTRLTVAGCTTAGDSGRGSDYIRGSSTGPMAVQDALGAWWELARVGVLDAGAFCINLTGQVDSTAAMQAAGAQAAAWGSKLVYPPGKIRFSDTVTFNISALSDDQGGRFEITGAGRGLTVLQWAGSETGCALMLQGGSGFSNHANATVSNLMLVGMSGVGRGICVDKLADLNFTEVFTQSLTTPYDLTDVLSTRWFGGTTSFNKYGPTARRGTQSYPNAFGFYGHRLANNSEYGMLLTGGSSLTFAGGSVEGNGISGTGTRRGGIFLDQPGLEGGIAATVTGTYFEHNAGSADIDLTLGTSPVTLALTGNTFARIDSVNFTRTNVRVSGAANAGSYLLSSKGNAFREAGTYSASGVYPYIDTSGALGQGTVDADVAENGYMTPSTAPSEVSLKPVARVRFDGTLTSPTLKASNNIASVVKNSTGSYTVNLARPTRFTPKSVTVMTGDLPTVVQLSGEDTGSVSFFLFNTSGARVDSSNITVNVYDG